MKSTELLYRGGEKLKNGGIVSPICESGLILSHLLGKADDNLLINPIEVNTAEVSSFDKLINLRLNKQPLAYLIGYQYFYGRKFFVTEGVFIPRYDSEILVLAVLNYLRSDKVYNINTRYNALDWGIGTGVLMITLILECPQMKFVGVDINHQACQVAEINVKHHGLVNTTPIYQVDGFTYSKLVKSGSIDILISNPPYIKSSLLEELSPEVQKEPISALLGGKQGIEVSLKILESYYDKIAVNGRVFLETDNAKLLIKEAIRYGYQPENTYPDLSGQERVVVFKKKEGC
ncbi:MAG: Release factor glutamine methyltransferase [candidate division WS2 bacterium]|nr:Release factor glutamine methyltransferase [Candidatus Psychracetigena formicireducens]